MVVLKTLGKVFNITNIVDKNIKLNHTLTGLFDSGELVIPFVNYDRYDGIDLSRKIPRLSVVEITTLEGKTQWFVEKSDVEKVNKTDYKHFLKLIEPKWLLQDRPLPNYSITQPQVDVVGIYTTETSSIAKERIYGYADGLEDWFDLTVSQVSNDLGIIENRVIKVAGNYILNFNVGFGRTNAAPFGFATVNELNVMIYANNTLVYTHEFGSFTNGLYPMVGTQSFTKELAFNESDEIKARWYLRGSAGDGPIWLNIKSGFLTIEKEESEEARPIYMDEVVNKVLRMVNVSEIPEVYLEAGSASRLSQILAFDDIHTEATLYTALERIASFIKARLYVELSDFKKAVRFEFYEDMSLLDYFEPTTLDKITSAPSNDYVSALALENNNVVRENTLIELGSIRSLDERAAQITTDNIAFRTNFPIDRIKSIRVRGKPIKDTNGNNVLISTNYLDITANLREKAHYDTLDKMANYDNRLINNQNNHLYFVRGENLIHGLSFVGVQFTNFTPNNSNRSLYETMATILQREFRDITIQKFIDTGLSSDMEIEYRIEYYPMSQSNAFIMKDDQSGFMEKRIKRLNANDRVNNAEYLGDYARTKVNSLGGTIKSVKGESNNPNFITQLGTVSPNNERVVDITKIIHNIGAKETVEYYPTLVKDYVFQSYYIGIDSERRLLHVPRDEFVKRIDKSLNVIYLGQNTTYENTSEIEPFMFMKVLKPTTFDVKAPKLAVLEFDEKVISAKVDVGATGNTIEWYLEMLDNYSAGNKRVVSIEQDFYYQYGVPYGDLFGRVEQVAVKFYENQQATLVANNSFPDGALNSGGLLSDFSYTLKKDAREQYALSFQTTILSEDDEVFIYSGVGKYNLMSRYGIRQVSLAILNYKPNRDDKFINIGLITPHENTANVYNEYFEVDLTIAGQGYAFYDTLTNELILAVSKELGIGKHRVYYRAASYILKTGDGKFHIYHKMELNNEISIIEQSITGELINVINDIATAERTVIGVSYNSNLTSEISITEQTINSEMISVINDIIVAEITVIGIKVSSSLSSEISIVEQSIISEMISINNNLLVFNDIFKREKYAVGLSSSIEFVEQSIVSEVINVINDTSSDIEVVVRAIIGIKVEASLSSEINIIEQSITGEMISINNNLLVYNNINKSEKYAVGLSNQIEVLEQNIVSEMISVINDTATDIEVVKRAIIGIKVDSSLSSEISMVEQSITGEVINVNNNLLVFNNINTPEKYAVGLSNPIDVNEQSIVGELINVNNSIIVEVSAVAHTKTKQPTININGASCYIYHNDTTELHISITNNDAGEVTIYRGNTSNVLGIITGGSTRTLFYENYDLPGEWSASVTAQASGRIRSNLETKSGNILLCQFI